MSNKLINFHKKLKKEFHEYLDSFNILFYGYGCKRELLKYLFPNTITIDGLTDSISQLMKQIKKKYRIKEDDILSLDSSLKKGNINVIIHNFSFEKFALLKNLKKVKIIGTIEKINYNFSLQEIIEFNFIFRDLTTFIPYKENVIVKNHSVNKYRIIENIFINVQKQAQIIFIELIQLFISKNKITVTDLAEKMKIKLLMKDRMKCYSLLNEFIDHNIVKINEEEVIEVKIPKAVAEDFMQKYKNTNEFKN